MEIACTIITYSRQCELSKKHAYSFHGSMYVLRSVKYLSQSVTFYRVKRFVIAGLVFFIHYVREPVWIQTVDTCLPCKKPFTILLVHSLATAAQSSPCFLTAYFSSASSSGDHLPAFFALAGSM
jgi:hypothetical protein